MAENIEQKAKEIIAQARAYREGSSRRMNYTDYEVYKKKLLINGCYGYERELADALNV